MVSSASDCPASRPSLAVLFLVNVLNFYDRQVFGAVLEPLRREFHLTDTQLGALPTTFVIVYALAGCPWAVWRTVEPQAAAGPRRGRMGGAHRTGRRSSGYMMLFVTRSESAIGEAVCAPAAASWIGDIVPAAARGRAPWRHS